MDVRIIVDNADYTDEALLEATRINYDSSRRITTANITLIGTSPGEVARYDEASYDVDRYGIDLRELMVVRILDGRDGITKLFEGQIYGVNLKQTDGEDLVYYECDLNDYGSWLDRTVAWDDSFVVPMPTTDQDLIVALVGRFLPQIDTSNVALYQPGIMAFEWKGKTLRQVLDDVCALTRCEWRVDFDARLFYGPVGDAPPAPYRLSTSPDFVASFPVRVDSFKRDFSNPVNRAYVRGAYSTATGILAQAEYADPVSIAKYGEYSFAEVSEQITETYDAELRAKTTVLKYAYPIEQGEFTIWTDDLQVGQLVDITEDALGIAGSYIIRSLSLTWKSKDTVEYRAQFGAAKPDLESYLRILDQRTRWKSQNQATVGIVPPGSVTDASIAEPGLSADVIQSVNANSILGLIAANQIGSVSAEAIVGEVSADQIGSVDAGVIVGQIVADQIYSVNASSIEGVIDADNIGEIDAGSISGTIEADQIGSVHAGTITGVIVSDQLANGIIDELGKFADALRPVPIYDSFPALPSEDLPPNSYFHNTATGHFYRINADGISFTDVGTNPDTLSGTMKFYTIGRLSAQNITGLIVAAQIQNINAGQIVGQIQAAQIQTITAGQITGKITAGQIQSVDASTIQGGITADKITSVNASAIAGKVSADKIDTITAGQITGFIQAGQIGSVSGTTINLSTIGSDKLDAFSLNIGGGGSKPGRLNVYDGASNLIAQIGLLDQVGGAGTFGGWFKVLGVAGTGWGDAKLKADGSGGLSLTDIGLSISGGGARIYTSPTTFDSTYSTVALVNESGSDKASFTPRGMVLYYGGAKIGAVVRDPAGGYATLEFNATGGRYIGIFGQTGIVRADGGFQQLGNVLIDSTGKFFPTNGLDTAGGINANLGYLVGGTLVISSAKAFVGNGVDVGSFGVRCGGVNPFVGGQNWTGQSVDLQISTPTGTRTLQIRGGVIVNY